MKTTNYVYVHRNKINGKVYVGQTINPSRRWRNGKGYLENKVFSRAIEKYGWNSFEHIIVAENLTKSQANELETDLIYWFRSSVRFEDSNGYNVTLGGEGKPFYETEEERQLAIKNTQKASRRRKYLRSEAFKLTTRKKALLKERRAQEEQKKSRKATEQLIWCIEDKALFQSYKDAAEYYQVSETSIQRQFSIKSMTSCSGKHFIHFRMTEYEQYLYNTSNPLDIKIVK